MPSSHNIVICSSPATGHVHPAIPIATELVARGHDVRWYTGREFRSIVASTGARWEPIVDAHDPADAAWPVRFPERGALEGLAGMRFDFKHIFLDEAVGQLADLRRIEADRPIDLLVADTAFVAASMWAELTGRPYASYGISVLPIPSRDLPPLGRGLLPRRTAVGRTVDRLAPLITRVLFRDVQRHHNLIRRSIGLAATRKSVFDAMASPYLYVQGSTESFEYPRTDLPEHVHYVGPLLAPPPPWHRRPDWWDDLNGGRPVVVVTQGTVADDPDDLINPALEALHDDDVLVIVAGRPNVGEAPADVPENARVEPFIPFGELLPRADVLVTNGGYGGVQMALSAGVPLVVAGTTEDKPEVAARVEWSGAGINLRTKRPTPDQIRDAVRATLRDGRYRDHARRLQADALALDPAARAADLVERLADTHRAVGPANEVRDRACPAAAFDRRTRQPAGW